jgi:hypothetical protein
MAATLLTQNQQKDRADNVKPCHIVLIVTVLTLGILSVTPGICANEASEVNLNGSAMGEPFAPDAGASIDLAPFQINQNLTLAVTESPDEAAEADQLAKQLSNPVASLISVPFQANEDWGFGPTGNGYKFTLNIQPVIPISISKDWNLIIRTIFPIVSQHDLFYFANLPKDSPLQPQNRSQDGLSDTTQSFFLSPKKPGPFGLIWGLGPAFLYPTGTHPLLDTGTFSIGPTFVGLKQEGPWTIGVLMNQLWSVVISEHRSSVSQMFVQPFITYTTKSHTTFTINTETTANWNASSTTANGRCQSFFRSARFLRLGSNRSASRSAVNTMPTHRAMGQIGVCALTSRCSTRQAGTPSLLREQAW